MNHFTEYDLQCATKAAIAIVVIVGIILLAVYFLTAPASATILITMNASRDGALSDDPADAATSWAALKSSPTGTATDPIAAGNTVPGGRTATTSTNEGYNYHQRGIVAFPSYLIPDSFVITGAWVNFTSSGGQSSTLTKVNASLVDALPNSYTDFVDGDYSRTNFVRQANDIPYDSIPAANGTVSFILTNLTQINKTGYTAFIMTHNYDVDNLTFTWSSSKNAFIIYRSNAYAGGAFAMQLTVEGTFNNVTNISPLTLINETRILPNTDTNLPPQGLNVSINATPGQYEQASFIIKPDFVVNDMNITATDLSDGAGHTLYANNTDIKTLKVWYVPSNSDTSSYGLSGSHLRPELLLNNDSVVRVNLTAGTNEVYNFATDLYIPINVTSDGTFPITAKIFDNKSAGGFPQPFALTENENRQIWITQHVPIGTTAGNYTGIIWVNSSVSPSVAINFSVRVLPFTLPNSTKTQSIYFNYRLNDASTAGSWFVDEAYPAVDGIGINVPSGLFNATLTDMKNHGITYPSTYLWGMPGTASYGNLEKDLSYRAALGFPRDKIYLWWNPLQNYLSAGSNQTGLMENLTAMKNLTTTYGYTAVYVYGKDEPTTAQLAAELPSLITASSNGTFVYFATNPNSYDNLSSVANYTSLLIVASEVGAVSTPNETAASKYRTQNSSLKLFTYDFPQAGVPNPEIYRTNAGLVLWNSTYDGAMEYSYVNGYGQSYWNLFDQASWGELNPSFIFPTSDGVIDTIQWEGYREGVDDSRYADTLSNITGNKTEATAIINAGIAAGQDMSQIRNTLISHILAYGGAVHPTASFTLNRVIVMVPQLVIVNDSSTNTPTGWNYSWGDGQWSNGTANATHSYSRKGLFTISQTVSNTAGSNISTARIWSYTRTYALSPFRTGYVSCADYSYSLNREITELERVMTDEKYVEIICN